MKKSIWVALVMGCAFTHAAWSHTEYYYAKARVVDVAPVVQTVYEARPYYECWKKPVYQQKPSYISPTLVVLGGIVGGVVGHQFGSGSGNVVATVAGTLLGGAIGYDGSRRYLGRTPEKKRCKIIDEGQEMLRVKSYRVVYLFKGKTFATHMKHHPGQWVTLRVKRHH